MSIVKIIPHTSIAVGFKNAMPLRHILKILNFLCFFDYRSDGMPARESSDQRAVISSNEIFSGLLKMYLDDKRIRQNNDSGN